MRVFDGTVRGQVALVTDAKAIGAVIAEALASLAVFLASAEARWMTGEIVNASGGA